MKKQKNLLFKILTAALILFLLFNGRAIVGNLIHRKKLKKDIQEIAAQNAALKNEIFHLQNNYSYLIRIVKNEYRVISENEIEYRFSPPNIKK